MLFDGISNLPCTAGCHLSLPEVGFILLPETSRDTRRTNAALAHRALNTSILNTNNPKACKVDFVRGSPQAVHEVIIMKSTQVGRTTDRQEENERDFDEWEALKDTYYSVDLLKLPIDNIQCFFTLSLLFKAIFLYMHDGIVAH